MVVFFWGKRAQILLTGRKTGVLVHSRGPAVGLILYLGHGVERASRRQAFDLAVCIAWGCSSCSVQALRLVVLLFRRFVANWRFVALQSGSRWRLQLRIVARLLLHAV